LVNLPFPDNEVDNRTMLPKLNP